jgi:hypothetical protein
MKRTLLISAITAFSFVHMPSAYAAAEEDKAPLVQRVLALWHIENSVIAMVQRPATDAMLQARAAIGGRLTAEKQEITLKAVAKNIQKYVDEATPLVKANAERLKAPVLTPLLLQNFSAEELRQLISLLESPVKKKFESLSPQFEKAFGEKVVQSSGEVVNPKLQAMTKEVGLTINAAVMTP